MSDNARSAPIVKRKVRRKRRRVPAELKEEYVTTMNTAKARLVYFEKWLTGRATDIIKHNGAIELEHLSFDSGVQFNETVLQTMHGYQILPRTER